MKNIDVFCKMCTPEKRGNPNNGIAVVMPMKPSMRLNGTVPELRVLLLITGREESCMD